MYGDGHKQNLSLIPQLKKALLRGDKTFNMSGGEQLRDYFHVKEAAQILVTLAMHNDNIRIINICSGKPVSIRAFLENWLIKKQLEN